jgi:membrane protein
MDSTLGEVRRDIEHTRASLADKITRLEAKVETVRKITLSPAYHVRTHPWSIFGISVSAGWLLGRLTQPETRRYFNGARKAEAQRRSAGSEMLRGAKSAAAQQLTVVAAGLLGNLVAGRIAGDDDGHDAKGTYEAAEIDRGRQANRPAEIPRLGWKDIAFRVKDEVAEDRLSIIAAAVAFYAFLAIFPALAALVSIYGLITDANDLQRHISGVQSVLPAQAAELVNTELHRIAQAQDSHLGWGLVAGILLAVWSAAKGMKVMFESLNVAYDETEKRGFLRLNATAVMLTLGAILFVIIFLGLIVGVPAVLNMVGMAEFGGRLINYLRWPLLALCGIFALSVLYRYGPSRDQPQWKWTTWGAVIATLVWLLGSFLFSFYVAHFGSYDKTYGSIGVVVVMMTWFLLSVYSILLGAEINAEMEHQTVKDTTEGKSRAMGSRGAYVADTIGRRA